MQKIEIVFPDNTKKFFLKGVTPKQIAETISPVLARQAVAAKINNVLRDLDSPITTNSKLKIVTLKEKEGMKVLWHTTSHVLAEAVLKLFPKTLLAIGPPTENGFYYDFDSEHIFSPKDFLAIEKEMQKIIQRNEAYKRKELSFRQAMNFFKGNTYKQEIIKEKHKSKEKITIYSSRTFTDLCKGPHLPETKLIKAFKLMKVAGAYWRGNEKNKMLQRIYGVSFPKKSLLEVFLEKLEQAEKRNHLRIGKELSIFSVHREAPGFIFLHDNGMAVWNALTRFLTEEQTKKNYRFVSTPMIMNLSLWKKSGHFEHYKKNMYFTEIDKQKFAVKPMNCPGHILIYQEERHSYKELPIKIAEFGTVHRHELSGVLHGLFRVRKFTQDDAHIFAAEKQITEIVLELMELIDLVYKKTGFKDYQIELSTKPEKAMGTKKQWVQAETALKKALEKTGKKYKVNEGEGAFYGPKIDFHIKDALERSWQLGTIQLDFQMPKKFGLYYIGKDDKKHCPVIIHRAILGSLERFIGILIEHYGGLFPFWLSPTQIVVLPVSEKNNEYAEKLFSELQKKGFRAKIDARQESLAYRVREAQLKKSFYVLVAGDKEEKTGSVTIRHRNNALEKLSFKDFLKKIQKQLRERL